MKNLCIYIQLILIPVAIIGIFSTPADELQGGAWIAALIGGKAAGFGAAWLLHLLSKHIQNNVSKYMQNKAHAGESGYRQ